MRSPTKYGTTSNKTVILIGPLCQQTTKAHGPQRTKNILQNALDYLLTTSYSYQALEWNNKTVCDQVLQYQSDNPITPDAFALLNNVPTAALVHLNPTRQDVLSPGDYCAPLPCTVAVIDSSESMSANNFVDSLDNITLTQFWSWNNYMDSKSLQPGEIVCIGCV